MQIIKITVAIIALFAAASAQASKFGVKVVSETGEPEVGVAVCIGTHGDYKQFGAHFTSKSGDVVIEVPNVPLVVTISKNRFTGVRMTEPARYFSLVKEVKLIEGVPGPRCRADTSLVDNAPHHELFIDEVQVDQGDSKISLQTSVDGQPTHYRISGDKSFAGARWEAYTSTIALSKRMAANAEVFLQVRKYAAANDAWLEARSQVMAIALPQS